MIGKSEIAGPAAVPSGGDANSDTGYRAEKSFKSPGGLFDSKGMANNTNTKNVNNSNNNTRTSGSSTNELIATIDQARNSGTPVKSIKKQKHDPSNFYFTLSTGKQVGPVNVSGDQNELNRKFGEAQSYLNGTKQNQPQGTNAA
ncbi:hypothetical protein BH09PLA1_BH09PLA1_31740 [soil metagenome]